MKLIHRPLHGADDNNLLFMSDRSGEKNGLEPSVILRTPQHACGDHQEQASQDSILMK